MLQRLGRFSYRRRWVVLAGWVALLIGLIVLSQVASGRFRASFDDLPDNDSTQAMDILEANGFGARTGDQAQIVFEAPQGVDVPAVRAPMERLFAAVAQEVPETEVVSPYASGAERQVADEGTIAYAEVNLADRSGRAYGRAEDQILALADQYAPEAVTIEYGGEIFADERFGGPSEIIGLLAAIVILLVAFGSVLAMGLPILTAFFGIGCGIALVGLVANFINIPEFATQGVAMIGIGVGIDYALFVVTRYREGLVAELEPEQAVVVAIDTAGRAVLFAGTTVVVSLLGLLVVGLELVQGVAIGMALGVTMTMLAAVTLLPAVLGFTGRNIDKLGLPHRKRALGAAHRSIWQRWSRAVQRRPAVFAALGFVVLIVLAIPLLQLRLGIADAGNRPERDTTRRAYDLLADGFGPGFSGPLLLAAETPGGAADTQILNDLVAQLEEAEGVAEVSPPVASENGAAAVIQVVPTTSPQDEETERLVHRLRDDVVPAAIAGTDVVVKVGGQTAVLVDFAGFLGDRLPYIVFGVLVLSFIVLLLVFRSVLVPVKAVVMNLLSIGAAYGVVVAVFQWGWGEPIGISTGPIEAWAPMFLFAVVFGLSMDYEVFLLSRIKEEYDRTGDNATAVADGLAASARVITAAAGVMVVVFASFAFTGERALQIIGVGMATAVLVDATIVRLLLVPATMELLGDRNWWLPGWLDRLLPRIHVEGGRELGSVLGEFDVPEEERDRVGASR